MIETVCDYIHNFFDYGQPSFSGVFSISDGSISFEDGDMGIQEGQYYRIMGSVFNDGVHKRGEESLRDETDFSGEVRLMAVPPAVEKIVAEIAEWEDKYGATTATPYTSESFGGYSYSKAQGAAGGQFTWADVFGKRLNRWRKIA